jgi:hypothetical protein
MDREDFLYIRGLLRKTQKQMADLLGISVRGVESFEQGLRYIPVHIERQMLFLLASLNYIEKNNKPCWTIRKCALEKRRHCPAWEFQIGHLCWFINGTICHGEVQDNWQEKIKLCKQCEVFQPLILPNKN